MARRLMVEIVGDADSLGRAYKQAERQTAAFGKQISRTLKTAAAVAGVGFGAAQVVDFLKDATSAASDLNEQASKTQQVFGSAAGDIKAWAHTTATSFGIAERQALGTASSFGALFAPLGITGQAAAEQSRKLTELGADLASFYNTDVQSALDAIRSGVVGEAEPLRRYGAVLSETRVQQQALADTGKKHVQSLTLQEKALARIELIFQDTTKAQGDFARTSQGLANQQRVLAAQFDELKVKLGTALLPAVTDITKKMNVWLSNTENQQKIVDGFTTAVTELGTAIQTAADIADKTRIVIHVVLDTRKKVKDKAGPFGFLVEGLDSAVGQFSNAYGNWLEVIGMAKEKKDKEFTGKIAKYPFLSALTAGLTPRTFTGADFAVAAKAAGAKTPPDVKATTKPLTTKQKTDLAMLRNQWFDATVTRQLDRVQDLSLRKQLARLKTIASEVQARLAITKDLTRRLTLEDKLVEIMRQQRSVQADITDQIKQANQALKDRADAIKSAVLDRLQRKQTDVLNKRALADATEQLRIARQIGGPKGIQAAVREMQDVRFDIQRARLEAAPATLTAGGQFGYGGVTININGVTDPDQVARKVVQVLQKRQRHTTSQTRGPSSGTHAAGPAAGAH